MPEHLEAQERALATEMHLRQTMTGLPTYGFSALQWNQELFEDGVLALTEVCLLLKGGHVLSVPHNATCEPLNLGQLGNVDVAVYLHWMSDDGSVSQPPDWSVGDVRVPRVMHNLKLSTTMAEPDAQASFNWSVFEKSPDGAWSLTHEYVPRFSW